MGVVRRGLPLLERALHGVVAAGRVLGIPVDRGRADAEVQRVPFLRELRIVDGLALLGRRRVDAPLPAGRGDPAAGDRSILLLFLLRTANGRDQTREAEDRALEALHRHSSRASLPITHAPV